MSTTDEALRIDRVGSIAVLTLSRPERRNALDRALVRRIGDVARELGEDSSVRSVVITGEGNRVFCAGADLNERRSMTESDVREMLALYRTEFGAVDRLDKPVIAAINGAAYGGGLELALACDLRIMAEDATLGLTEVSLAIIPGAGGTQRLSRLVGEARAKELVLFSKRLSAREAHDLGIVNAIGGKGSHVLETAIGWATHFERAAPIAVAAALEAIDAAGDLPLDDGLEAELRAYEKTLVSKDRIEALEAFRAKREPVFRGV